MDPNLPAVQTHVATAVDRTQQHHAAAVSAVFATTGTALNPMLRPLACQTTREILHFHPSHRANHNPEHAALVADA